MSKVSITTTLLDDLADAIAAKTGESTPMSIADMTDAVDGITSRDSTDLSASGATVTVPAGMYASAASKSVATGSATAAASISATGATVSTGTNTLTLSKTVSNTPQVTAGYVSSGTAGNSSVSLTASVTTQAAQTIYPSSSQQTIASGRYLTGTQTIAPVTTTNLTAGNIKSGVVVQVGDASDPDRVTSVTGTYSGGGGSASVDTKTVTASNRPSTLSFTSMKGEPIMFALKATFTMTSSSSTYYYVDSMRGYLSNGSYSVQGRLFRMGSTRQTEQVQTGYSATYSGGTLTLTSTGNRTTSPGCYYNGSYELVYVY